MSYSFSERAISKDELIEKFDRQWDSVVKNQPPHKADRDIATCAFKALLDVLPEDSSKDLIVSTHGSVSYTYPEETVYGIDVSLSVRSAPRD